MIFRVKYQSMSASYGPAFIEADSELEARRKYFRQGCFLPAEMGLIYAELVSSKEIRKALEKAQEED